MYPEHNSKLMQEWVKHALNRHGDPLYVVPPVTRPLPADLNSRTSQNPVALDGLRRQHVFGPS